MVAVLAAAFVTPACQRQAQDAVDVNIVDATVTGSAPVADLSSRSTDDLAAAADRALRDGRLYVPAGDNALEYWLEARAQNPDDAATASAIAELQPYLLIGCEQAIARHDFVEAHRLHGLLAASDPGAPALERLAGAIATAEAESGREEAARLAAEEAERQRLEADARAAVQARAAAERIAAVQAAATTAQNDSAVPAPAEAGHSRAPMQPPPQAPPQAPPQPRNQPVATVPVAVDSPSAPPRALHQPAPRYPSVALNRGVEGSVQVAFVIQPDGSVAETRIVDASPPGVFDRSALAAVGSYRFEVSERSVPSQVTLRFSLNQ